MFNMKIYLLFKNRKEFFLSPGAARLENALLDLMPDDAVEMNNKRRMLRWDAKKRKFVKVFYRFQYPCVIISNVFSMFSKH
jgi:hypothetical protein